MIGQKIKLKIWLAGIFACILLLGITDYAIAQEFQVSTNTKIFSEGQVLFVYGKAEPNEGLIMRLLAPDGSFAKFDQITTSEDGSFQHVLLIWPESSATFPFGTYRLEVIKSGQQENKEVIDLKFTSSSEVVEVPVERHVNTLVFAPETIAVNNSMRIFVQTTSDGLLIGGDPNKLLATTHVHLPNEEVQSLTSSFKTLHQGLYFVDYTPTMLGTYVFHVVTFHQGTVSHGSAATTVLSQDIGGISDQIIRLNTVLDETSGELDRLKTEIETFGSTLEGASDKIDKSVTAISTSVANIEEASIQLNSLLFPIVATMAIIVALQIVIIARRR